MELGCEGVDSKVVVGAAGRTIGAARFLTTWPVPTFLDALCGEAIVSVMLEAWLAHFQPVGECVIVML